MSAQDAGDRIDSLDEDVANVRKSDIEIKSNRWREEPMSVMH